MADIPPHIARALRGMNGARRFLLLGAAAALAVGVWWVGRWASAPTWVPLYHDLELSESGSIAEKLTKSDITYRLGGGGTQIDVSVADMARARVALAKDGLPSMGRPGRE